MIAEAQRSTVEHLFERLIHRSRPRKIRSILQFCREELIIPKGKLKGTRWRPETSPFQEMLLREMSHLALHESSIRRWRRFAALGCAQSGKSLFAFVAPILYHLFEIGEDVIALVPNVHEMGKDKWTKEVLPAIEASRYSVLLPDAGAGSQGGFAAEVTFKNGAALKWMSGSGGDAKRSSYTARVVVATEVDKMDTASESSREADPLSQAETRLTSYLPHERIMYVECTVSIEEGAIWQHWVKGSKGTLLKQCPHCGQWVCPEREHVRGFEAAQNEFEAETRGTIVCPECEHEITEPERLRMNQNAVLVHRGQTVDEDGNVQGELPPTFTMAFRWNAFDNHHQLTIAGLALEEWGITESANEQAKTKAACQFRWATPYRPPVFDLVPLKIGEVRERIQDCPTRDIIPADAECFVGSIDCHKHWLYWGLCAWRPEARGVIIAYGRHANPACEGDEAEHVERAILEGLQSLRDEVLLPGFNTQDGRLWKPQVVLVDSLYMTNAVHVFCAQEQSDGRFRPALGRGSTSHDSRYRTYRPPRRESAEIVDIGDEYHIAWDEQRQAHKIEMNSDHWKVQLHRSLQTPVGNPGSLSLFSSSNPREHNTFAKHLVAEKPFDAPGQVTRWVTVSDVNHYLDVSYMICVAGHICGVRLIEHRLPADESETVIVGTPIVSADGRPYMATERA